jgi:pyruvyl transferase EpsI
MIMNYKKLKARLLFIKKIIKIKYKSYCYYRKIEKKLKNNKGNKKYIFLIGTPLHENLGDHAIAMAEINFLNTYFPNINIYEIPEPFFIHCYSRFKKIIKDSTLIITGGGNMGTLWFHNEKLYRKIVEDFPKNKVIFFPQTIYFENSNWGNKEFEISKNTYNNHKNLHFCAREKNSYYIMKKDFKKNNVILVPDIVMFLKKDLPVYQRNGILLCFRKDIESILNHKMKKDIHKKASSFSKNINYIDNISITDISINDRKDFLEKKLIEYKKAKLIITDRLHGMIFSLITGTPCIALPNCNKKIIGTYDWIKDVEYIKLAHSINEITLYIEELNGIKNIGYDNEKFLPYFKKIIKIIKL